MRRLKKVALVILILLAASGAQAENKIAKAEWSYDPDAARAIDGFRLYDQDHALVIELPNPTARTAEFAAAIDPGQCRSYYLVAYQGAEDSPPSNIYPFCLPRSPLRGVGSFVIEFQ